MESMPEPEPMPNEDWSWVSTAACSEDKRIGDGGGCIGVYKLVSPLTMEAFAVKVVDRAEQLGGAKHSFRREVEIFSRLRHPGICRLRSVVSEPRNILLVIELAEGGELFDIVANQGGVSEPTARKLFQEILLAVEYCHSQGVFHRDLKLENVLRSTDGSLKVTDFGMAKDISVDSMPKTKRIGTVAYMAPEVADTGDSYDGAGVDVWSMGVMLYVMVVCNYPFGHDGPGGGTTGRVLQSIKSGKFSIPSNIFISGDMVALITGMLSVDPKARLTIPQIKAHAWLTGGSGGDGDGAGGAEVSMDEVPEIDWDSVAMELPLPGLISAGMSIGSELDFDSDEGGGF
jgi:serine/threonine-protein kinase SRK2